EFPQQKPSLIVYRGVNMACTCGEGVGEDLAPRDQPFLLRFETPANMPEEKA
ncbi:hypothetical protein chiPu_0022842, partial [Chiloscyllium punctatum]|nr:hypothetical protein [Chiloscyllium punctatum]